MIDLNHVTREELYEAVWAELVFSLAAKLGISDVGLAKIAHRLKVPLPGRGHWARGPMSRKLMQEPVESRIWINARSQVADVLALPLGIRT